jgi:hypothetical protein
LCAWKHDGNLVIARDLQKAGAVLSGIVRSYNVGVATISRPAL